MKRGTADLIIGVVNSQNCTGCGMCAIAFSGVEMRQDDRGFNRPFVIADVMAGKDSNNASLESFCPGISVRSPEPVDEQHQDAVLGPYLEIYSGYSTDPNHRHAASSGGALTEIAANYQSRFSDGHTSTVGASKSEPLENVRIEAEGAADVKSSAGSRYAPASLSQRSAASDCRVVVGKPCEIYAIRRFNEARGTESPLLMSMFCAGTPSADATIELAERLGIPGQDIEEVIYRGNGWPGDFTVKARNGASATLPYEDSWGSVLGRRVQWRCKICPDGLGYAADISVGDLWNTDSSGGPTFDPADGVSAIVVRTEKGRVAVAQASDAGVVTIAEISPARVTAVQPYQVERIATLAGRIMGVWLGGGRASAIHGFRLGYRLSRSWRGNLRALLGALRRRGEYQSRPASARYLTEGSIR